MSADDREGIALSLGVHAVLLLLLVLVAATPTETLDEDYSPQLTEIEFGVAPTLPVVEGPPESAPSAAPSDAAEQPEPERPAPAAATPARVPERAPTPPRERPVPRPVQRDEARPARPNPPLAGNRARAAPDGADEHAAHARRRPVRGLRRDGRDRPGRRGWFGRGGCSGGRVQQGQSQPQLPNPGLRWHQRTS